MLVRYENHSSKLCAVTSVVRITFTERTENKMRYMERKKRTPHTLLHFDLTILAKIVFPMTQNLPQPPSNPFDNSILDARRRRVLFENKLPHTPCNPFDNSILTIRFWDVFLNRRFASKFIMFRSFSVRN